MLLVWSHNLRVSSWIQILVAMVMGILSPRVDLQQLYFDQPNVVVIRCVYYIILLLMWSVMFELSQQLDSDSCGDGHENNESKS